MVLDAAQRGHDVGPALVIEGSCDRPFNERRAMLTPDTPVDLGNQLIVKAYAQAHAFRVAPASRRFRRT
jgi:hypothetical protein